MDITEDHRRSGAPAELCTHSPLTRQSHTLTSTHNHMVPRVPRPCPEDWAPLTGSLFPPCPILTTLPSCLSPSLLPSLSTGVWLRRHFSCALSPPPNLVTTNVTQKGCKEKKKKKKKKKNSSNRKCAAKVRSVTPVGGSTWQPHCRQAGGSGLHPHQGQAGAGPGQPQKLAWLTGPGGVGPEPHTVDAP